MFDLRHPVSEDCYNYYSKIAMVTPNPKKSEYYLNLCMWQSEDSEPVFYTARRCTDKNWTEIGTFHRFYIANSLYFKMI